MKTVLCFGDSLTWGAIPGGLNPNSLLFSRYDKNIRWPGVIQRLLGSSYDIVENAMNGRTTVFDEIRPGRPHRNGLEQLSAALETHYPIDTVILMLGTNDLKKQYAQSISDVVNNIRQLFKLIKSSDKGISGLPPQILLIAPTIIMEVPTLPRQFDANAIKMSQLIGKEYKKLAIQEGCLFLDAALYATPSEEGIHFDEFGHANLGYAIAKILLEQEVKNISSTSSKVVSQNSYLSQNRTTSE